MSRPLIATGFDDCILGLMYRFGQEPIVVYDQQRVIAKLRHDGMDWDEAIEYFKFKILGAWSGDGTPGYLERLTIDAIHDRYTEDNE